MILLRRSPDTFREEYLNGYAVSTAGARQLAIAYVREYFNYDDPLVVEGDDDVITVVDPDGRGYDFYVSRKREFQGGRYRDI